MKNYFLSLLLLSFSLGAMEKDKTVKRILEKPADIVVFHPDNERVAVTGSQWGGFYLLGGEEKEDEFVKDEKGVAALAFNSAGNCLATIGGFKTREGLDTYKLWNISTTPCTELSSSYHDRIYDEKYVPCTELLSYHDRYSINAKYVPSIVFNSDETRLYAIQHSEKSCALEKTSHKFYTTIHIVGPKYKEESKLNSDEQVNQFIYSPIHDIIFAGLESGDIVICFPNFVFGRSEKSFSLTDEHVSDAVCALSLNADNTRLASIHKGHSSSCVIWDVINKNRLITFKAISGAKFHPTNPDILALLKAKQKYISLLNTKSNTIVKKLSVSHPIGAFDFSHDGSKLAVTSSKRSSQRKLSESYFHILALDPKDPHLVS